MNKIVIAGISAILLICASTVTAQEKELQTVLDFNLHYQDKQITLVSIDKRQGVLPDYFNQPETGFTLQLLDEVPKEIFNVKFDFATQIVTENFSATGSSTRIDTLKETTTTVTTPYLPNAKVVNILNPNGNLVASQNLSLEAFTSYSEDQQKAKEQAQKAPSFKFTPLNILGLIFLVLIITSGLFFYRKHQQSQILNQVKDGEPVEPAQDDKGKAQ